MTSWLIGIFALLVVIATVSILVFLQDSKTLREAKNYERGLKLVPLLIHLPPSCEGIESGKRDERDLTDEIVSQAQVMYNIISSTATKGFKSKIYGQRHLSFEIVAKNGLIYYYAVVPVVLLDVVRQAIEAAYPSARLEETKEENIFSQTGKLSGTIGGEFTLKRDFVYPIATYQETKRDAARAILNALSTASGDNGVAVQQLRRPAREGWTKVSEGAAGQIKKDKGVKKPGLGGMMAPKDLLEAFWRPPESGEDKSDDKPLSSIDQSKIEAIED